jgi:excisionase family DNA binding protein
MTAPFVTTDTVAEMLGISRDSFYQLRDQLIEDQAFPLPMPYGRPHRWRRDMVEAWISEQGRPRALPPSPRPQGPNVVLMEEARRA